MTAPNAASVRDVDLSTLPEDQVGRYQCPHCGDRFSTMGDKRRHLRGDHQ